MFSQVCSAQDIPASDIAIAGITIGDSDEKVKETLGRPDYFTVKNGKRGEPVYIAVLRYGKSLVIEEEPFNRTVWQIRTVGKYGTTSGIYPGDSIDKVKELYGEAEDNIYKSGKLNIRFFTDRTGRIKTIMIF